MNKKSILNQLSEMLKHFEHTPHRILSILFGKDEKGKITILNHIVKEHMSYIIKSKKGNKHEQKQKSISRSNRRLSPLSTSVRSSKKNNPGRSSKRNTRKVHSKDA